MQAFPSVFQHVERLLDEGAVCLNKNNSSPITMLLRSIKRNRRRRGTNHKISAHFVQRVAFRSIWF